MSHPRLWTLRAEVALVATPFVPLALVSIAATVWVSWQLGGGAAAVDEAGRMLMCGVVWVSLIWMYRTEVRGTELTGSKARALRLRGWPPPLNQGKS